MVIGAFIVLLAATTAPPAPSPVSRADAESLARKLESLSGRPAAGKKSDRSVLLTEGEINAYVKVNLEPTLPAGLTELLVQLDRDRVLASARVDMELVKRHLGELSPWNPIALLSGRVPVTATGRYSGPEDGFGRVEVEDVRAAGIRIPVAFLEQIIAAATKSTSHPDGIDIHAPFRLPQPVRRLRLMPGRAQLDW